MARSEIKMARSIVNTDDIVGVEVRSPQGDKLGKIEAIMLDKLQGRVAYVVLSFGGFLGMGDKLFAIPWSMFSYNNKEECFNLSLDKETLKKSPGFDKDHWPDMSNPAWSSSIHKYYGTNAYPDHH